MAYYGNYEIEASKEAKKIIKKFNPVAVEVDGDKGGYSVLIKDKNSNFQAWVDIWGNGEEYDWNQYSFSNKTYNDVLQQIIQNDLDVFDMAISEAFLYLETKGLYETLLGYTKVDISEEDKDLIINSVYPPSNELKKALT